jgi:hypothetical protein
VEVSVSAILSVLPVSDLEELALQALQSKLTVDEVVDELVKIAMALKLTSRIKQPWRSIVEKAEKPALTFVIRGIVSVAEGKLIEAGVLPAPALAA